MKSVLEKVVLMLIILILLFSINTEVFAWSEIIKDGQSFLGQADENSIHMDVNGLKNVSGYLYNILLGAGVVIAVIVATVLGVQFMMSGAEGQAKVKEMLLPFIVGCVIVFGGFGFWKIAITVGKKLESDGRSNTSTRNI